MKTLIASLTLFLCIHVAAQSQRLEFKSTEILPENKVVFRIFAPKATEVALRTDIKAEGKVLFKKDSRGVWEGVYSDVPVGAYRYRFVVDGVTLFDPKASSATEAASIFVMPSGEDFSAMKKDVPHGGITEHYYNSTTLKELRRLHVWTPPGFEKSKEQLPVLYLIHGGGDTDNAWSTVGCAGNIMDNLLAKGMIDPMIVVMPNARIKNTKTLDQVPVFTKDLITGIIPFIESTYHVYPDSAHRAIVGLSLGGLQTLEAALLHHDKFGYIGVLSSGWWISDTWKKKRGVMDDIELRTAQLRKIAPEFNKSVKLLHFTQGGPEDIAYDNGMDTLKLFDVAGIEYKSSESPGGHSWVVWRKNLWDLAPRLFK